MTSTTTGPGDVGVLLAAPDGVGLPPGAPAAVAPAGRTAMTEKERIAALKEIMGEPDGAVRAFPQAIRTITFQTHDRWVKPLYEAHWPEALAGSTAKKLRFLTCNLYATAPYTVLFSSARPPVLVRALRALGTRLGLERATLAACAGVVVKAAAWTIDDVTHRRIVQIAAFIAAVDHVFDHCMGGVSAEERGLRMRGVLDGSWSAGDEVAHAGAFRFLRALFLEMAAGISGEDKAVFDVAVARLHDYLDSEVKAMTGVPDPSGCCWRMAGVLGTIDGLFFPVWRYATPPAGADALQNRAREWMYSVSLFVQVMDDWIDLEKDAGDIRPTPVLTGFWTLETVRETWEKTMSGIVELARSSGVEDESWLAFVAQTYRMMAIEVMEAMSKGSAA
jgi:hypothetical protein